MIPFGVVLLCGYLPPAMFPFLCKTGCDGSLCPYYTTKERRGAVHQSSNKATGFYPRTKAKEPSQLLLDSHTMKDLLQLFPCSWTKTEPQTMYGKEQRNTSGSTEDKREGESPCQTPETHIKSNLLHSLPLSTAPSSGTCFSTWEVYM